MRLKNFLKYFVFLHFVFLFPTITSAQNISLQKDAADTANTGTVDLGSGVTITGTPAIAGNPLNIENIRNSILTNSVTNLGGVTLTPPGSITSIVESANQQQLSHFIINTTNQNIADANTIQGIYDANNALNLANNTGSGALSIVNGRIVDQSTGKEVVPATIKKIVTDTGSVTITPTAAQIAADQAADPSRIYLASNQVVVQDYRTPTYINNSTSLCGSSGCTYTLMAPIGSLLGNEKGQYVINKSDKGGLCVLFNSWFRIGIALAGMLAVVMIVLGGFQYATTDAMTSKSEGKSKIQNALWGLMLALTTWLVLNTVNPDLVNCTINASEVQLSALQMSVSGALGGDLFGIGMLGTNNALRAVSSNGGGVSQAQIDAEYNNAYSQWTDADDELLRSDPDNAGALAKWEGIQMQIEGLNTKYANQPVIGSTNSNVGQANQKVLQQVRSGSNKCTASHCFAGAEALADDAGVKFNSVFQNSNYVSGGKTLGTFGAARLPSPGEQVDYLFYTDGTKSDPYHTVIVESINADGSAVVWDWKNPAATGYRKVNFNLTNPGTKGYIGRIYVPSNK